MRPVNCPLRAARITTRTTPLLDWRNFPASANGRRITSRCAPCAGLTRFRKRTLSCAKTLVVSRPARRKKCPKPGVPGAATPFCIFGKVRSKNLIMKTKINYVYKIMPTEIGKLKLIASDKGLAAILWENDKPNRVRLGTLTEDKNHPMLLKAERELAEYLDGKRKTFTVKLDPAGTPFQNQ